MPHVAGSTCAVCNESILGVLDGYFCPECHAPLHKTCYPTAPPTPHDDRCDECGCPLSRGKKWRTKSRDEKRSVRRALGAKDLRFGCLIFAGGLGLTCCCTAGLFAPNGRVVIFTGPIIIGLIIFFGGLRAMRR